MINKEKIIVLLLIFNLILGVSAFGMSFYLIKLSNAGKLNSIKPADSVNANDESAKAGSAIPADQLPEDIDIQELDPVAGELASSFASVYGNASLKELGPKMTEEMKKREAQKEKTLSRSKTPVVQITTTGILSQQVISLDDKAGMDLLMLTTERIEKKDGGDRKFSQGLLLTIVRVGNGWKVDNAEWQKESQ
ncbi:MAG: hypothetical protein WCW77_04055 [Patescibacteria group bacterium]|jgi:hypothetical protein